jgi:hypothetical protein
VTFADSWQAATEGFRALLSDLDLPEPKELSQ